MEKKYYIVRAKEAGLFFGQIKERKHNEVTMMDVQKIFYWQGACGIEQLAVDGMHPNHATIPKVSIVVDEMIIFNPVEIIPCTDKARDNLKAIKICKIQ